MRSRIRVNLPVEEMPKKWYNVKADLPFKLDPPLHPATQQPMKPEELSRIFPPSIVEQEAT
ncbi:MAG: tryptophan synthase beta chain, partial [Kosmotoga sp.]|nr:tryptophan synthase beta chain [Kosmotoga sp.]